MALVPAGVNAPGYSNLPAALSASLKQLVVEKLPSGQGSDLAVRDSNTGFTFFKIQGHQYAYDSAAQSLAITNGRLLISKEFANALGRPSDAGSVGVSVINGDMTAEFTINITTIFSGTLTVTLPAGAITDQFGNPNAAFTGTYQYVGTAPPGCGLLVGSGMTLGYAPNGWNPTLATNTVQYTFAISQPAANDFALFETHDPWGFTILKDAITANGHTYTVFTPADLATVDFSQYRVVVLNWDDTFLVDFITPYSAAVPALEAYASTGGVVWVQGAIQGSPGDNYPMPFGGQGNGEDFSPSDPVVDPSSPMMLGMPNPIPGNSASHVSFTSLPRTGARRRHSQHLGKSDAVRPANRRHLRSYSNAFTNGVTVSNANADSYTHT
jgi:hypothetical protein